MNAHFYPRLLFFTDIVGNILPYDYIGRAELGLCNRDIDFFLLDCSFLRAVRVFWTNLIWKAGFNII